MRRRLYFLLPDVESARHTADDLLLARVEDRHMHFLARRGTDLAELHEAGYLIKTDFMHGAGVGLGLGALGGALLGAWVASMVGASVPNSKLRQFQREIELGKVLLMVDVPYDALDDIRDVVSARHPEAVPAGQVRPYPVFP